MERIAASPRVMARIAGLFYLLTFVTGMTAIAFAGRFVIKDDPIATAHNILAHRTAFLAGWALTLVATIAYIVVTALFYELFKPVNKAVSTSAAFFSVVGCALGGISSVFQLAALYTLENAHIAGREQLAFAFLRARVDTVGLIFFGCYCLQIGWLAYRSTFIPRFVGAGMIVAGLGWLTFLWPPLVQTIAPFNMLPGVLGEALLTVWLLAAGVNAERWHAQPEF